MNATSSPLIPRPSHLIVLWRGYAVRFHTNACGKIFSLVAVENGTPFATVDEAVKAVHNCKLKAADYEIIRAVENGGKEER